MCKPCEKNWFVALIVCTIISLLLGSIPNLELGRAVLYGDSKSAAFRQEEIRFVLGLLGFICFLVLLSFASALTCCCWNASVGRTYTKVAIAILPLLCIILIVSISTNDVSAKSFCSEQQPCYSHRCVNCVDSEVNCAVRWSDPPSDKSTYYCSVKHTGVVQYFGSMQYCGNMFYYDNDGLDDTRGMAPGGRFRGFKSQEDCVSSLNLSTTMWTGTLVFVAALLITIVPTSATAMVGYNGKIQAISKFPMQAGAEKSHAVVVESAIGAPVAVSNETKHEC